MKWMFLSIPVFLTLCTLSTVQAEEILLSAGSGPLVSVIKPLKDAFEKETGIKMNNLFGSSPFAFKQLYNGVTETAVVGISFDEILEILKNEGFKVENPGDFRSVTIGRGMVRTVVNKGNPVAKLSREQLKGIFTGKITNWKEVGGNDSPIMVVLSPRNPGVTETFRKNILENEPYTREFLELTHMDELRGAVEVNAEAITIGTSAVLSNGVKQVATPDVFRPITLITKGEPAPKIRKFIDFVLKGAGKGLVKE